MSLKYEPNPQNLTPNPRLLINKDDMGFLTGLASGETIQKSLSDLKLYPSLRRYYPQAWS